MYSVNYGSKRRVIGASHYGVGDWLVQRASALYMLLCIVSLPVFLALYPLNWYGAWKSLAWIIMPPRRPTAWHLAKTLFLN